MLNTLRLGRTQVTLFWLVFLLVLIASLPGLVLLLGLDLHDLVSPINQRASAILAVWLITLALAMAVVWQLAGRWVGRDVATAPAPVRAVGAGQPEARTAASTSPGSGAPGQQGIATERTGEAGEWREQVLGAGTRQPDAAPAGIRPADLPPECSAGRCAREQAELEDLQHSVLDSLPQLVWLADLDGSVTFANRNWSDRIGGGAYDCKGDGWSEALHPEDHERVTREWREAVSSKDRLEIRFRLLHRDGGYHYYEANLQKAFGKTGEAECWVGIGTDVTRSRHRDNALRVANQELLAFYSAVSHDLRAPLRAVAGFGERLHLESAGRLDEQGRHYLERIQVGAARLNELIDDLLSFGEITRTDIAMGKVDLSKLARQVFDELRQHEPERTVEIVIQDGMAAIGDARLLRVVFVNLIGNALKFSGKREVSRIEIGENALPGDTSMFFVRDNGAGFDPAYAAKIFGIFKRLHSAKEFPGRGIGLATVQRIIHKHGGRVSAEGAVDQGAKICFWLLRT